MSHTAKQMCFYSDRGIFEHRHSFVGYDSVTSRVGKEDDARRGRVLHRPQDENYQLGQTRAYWYLPQGLCAADAFPNNT